MTEIIGSSTGKTPLQVYPPSDYLMVAMLLPFLIAIVWCLFALWRNTR